MKMDFSIKDGVQNIYEIFEIIDFCPLLDPSSSQIVPYTNRV